MKTTKRFDNAVRKLYTAFHKGKLDAMNCNACAVGNIVGHGNWAGWYPSLEDCLDHYPKHKDYSKEELKVVEFKFLTPFKNAHTVNGRNKDLQFEGLCAVIEYLCELDNIPNVLDYTKLFETEEGKPKYELA